MKNLLFKPDTQKSWTSQLQVKVNQHKKKTVSLCLVEYKGGVYSKLWATISLSTFIYLGNECNE